MTKQNRSGCILSTVKQLFAENNEKIVLFMLAEYSGQEWTQ